MNFDYSTAPLIQQTEMSARDKLESDILFKVNARFKEEPVLRYQGIILTVLAVVAVAVVASLLYIGIRWYQIGSVTGTAVTFNSNVNAPDFVSSQTTLNQLQTQANTLQTALQNVQTTPGPRGAIGPTGPAGSSGSLDPFFSHVIYVMSGGNDVNGTGQLGNPFYSISRALQSVSNANATNRFAIALGPMTDTGDSIILQKCWTWIIGAGSDASVIGNAALLTINPTDFNQTVTCTFGIKNVMLPASTKLSVDLQSMSQYSGAVTFEAENSYFGDNFVFRGLSTNDGVKMKGNQIAANRILEVGTMIISDDTEIASGNTYISDEGGVGVSATFTGGSLANRFVLLKANTGSFTVSLQGVGTLSLPSLNFTAISSGIVFTSDEPSTPILASWSKTAGVTLNTPLKVRTIASAILDGTGQVTVNDNTLSIYDSVVPFELPTYTTIGKISVDALAVGGNFTMISSLGAADATKKVGYMIIRHFN